MSVQDATSFAAIQPTLVSDQMFLTATALNNIPMLRTCLNMSQNSQGAISLKFPSHPAFSSAQSVTVGTALTATAATLGSKTLTKSTNRAIYEEGANTERANNNQDDLPAKLAQATGILLTTIETALGALYTGAGISRDAGLNDIAEADIQYLVEQFDAVNAPDDRRVLVLSPTQCSAVRKNPRFSQADSIGSGSSLITGAIGSILGFQVMRSNCLTSTGGQRQCLAYVAAPTALYDARQMGYGQTGTAPEGSRGMVGDCSISYAIAQVPAPYNPGILSFPAPFGRVTISYRAAAAANEFRADALYGVLNHKTEWTAVIKTNP